MAHFLITIKKRSTFIYVKDHGNFIRSSSFNLQILEDLKLEKTDCCWIYCNKKTRECRST